MVSADGEQLGIMPTQQALETARSQELDLVEVAPEAQPHGLRIHRYHRTQVQAVGQVAFVQEHRHSRNPFRG